MAMRHFFPMRIGKNICILAHDMQDLRMYAEIFAVGALSRTRMAIPSPRSGAIDDVMQDYLLNGPD